MSDEASAPTETCLSLPFEERLAAWKVLLPASDSQPILAVGIPRFMLVSLARSWPAVHAYGSSRADTEWAARQIERTAASGSIVRIDSESSLATSYLAIAVNADSPKYPPTRFSLNRLQAGGSVAWIGSAFNTPPSNQLSRQDYRCIRKYAILPPSGCRVIIPLTDSRLTTTSLDFFVPGKAANRLARDLALLIASVGAQDLLGLKQIVVARKQGQEYQDGHLLDWIRRRFEPRVVDAAIYPGTNETPGARKVTLQLLDRRGHVCGIAKTADMDRARLAIERESRALKRLNQHSELREFVPRVLDMGDWEGHCVQIQTSVGSSWKRFSPNLTSAHLEFLAELSQVDQMEILLEDWPTWSKIWAWAQGDDSRRALPGPGLREVLTKCADWLRDVRIPFHRIHGDFCRWNVLLGRHGLAVIDWENSEPCGLPGYDLVHFLASKRAAKRGVESWTSLLGSSGSWESAVPDGLAKKLFAGYANPRISTWDDRTVQALLALSACVVVWKWHEDQSQIENSVPWQKAH